MPRLVYANTPTAAERRVFFHIVGTDGITPATDQAGGQPQISANGAAWTDTGIGVLVAVGNGRYYADLTQLAVQTAGTSIETRFKALTTAECPGDSVQVVAFNPNDATRLGLAALPNANAGANNGLPLGNASGHVTPADGSLTTAKLGVFVLTKGTHIAGFNDIAATAIVSNGAITTSGGAVSNVTTTGAVTGNVGGSVASVTGNVGGSVASVTGNVGGSVASVVGGVGGNVAGSVGSVVGGVGGSVGGSVASVVGDVGGKVLGGGSGTIAGIGVRAVDGSGNAIAPAASALDSGVWTNGRAAKLDFLDLSIAAVNSAVSAITSQGAVIKIIGPDQMPTPSAGATVFEFKLFLFDVDGDNVNADGASNGIGSVTVTAANVAGASFNARLGAIAWVSTGVYKATYTVQSGDTAEQINVSFSAVVGTKTRTLAAAAWVAPFFATTFTSTDRTTLNSLATLASTNLNATITSRASDADVQTLLGRPSAPSAAAISATVWSETNRALTDKANFTLSSGERTAISGIVWSDGSRTLTDKLNFGLSSGERTTLSQAVRAEMDSASTRLSTIAAGVVTLTANVATVLADVNGYGLFLQTGVYLRPSALETAMIEDGVSASQALSYIGAATAGASSGAGTGTRVFKAMGNPGSTRIVAGVSGGNRTDVAYLSPPSFD